MDLHHLPPGGGKTGIIRSLFVSKQLSVNHFLLFLCLYNQRRKLGHAYISASVHGCQELSKRFGFKDNFYISWVINQGAAKHSKHFKGLFIFNTLTLD